MFLVLGLSRGAGIRRRAVVRGETSTPAPALATAMEGKGGAVRTGGCSYGDGDGDGGEATKQVGVAELSVAVQWLVEWEWMEAIHFFTVLSSGGEFLGEENRLIE